MNSKSFAFLSLLATLTTTLPAWALPTTWADLPSPLTEDTTVATGGSIEVGRTIDLAGHKLYLEGLTGLSGEGSFTDTSTDTANPGELHLILAVDATASTVGLTGNMRLLKSGTGMLTMANSNTSYTGGTVISNGTLKIGTTKQTLENFKPLGAEGSSVTVCKGGKFDVNGKYGFKGNYDVILDGGIIVNQAQRDNTSAFNPGLTMTADSTFSNSGSNKKYGFAAEGSLGGRVLTVEVESLLYWQPKIVDGTVMLTGTKELRVTADTDMRTVSFDESGAVLNMNGQTLSVSNYIANLAGSRTQTEGTLGVYGVFTPNTDNFFPPTMMDGSTIDLSAKEGSWAAGDTTFAEGATIAIEVGERADLSEGGLLVTWSETEYNGRTFNLTSDGVVRKDLALQAQAGGLAVVSTSAKIPTAIWKGDKSTDALDSENWDWRDAEGHPSLPDGTYVVEIAWNKLPELNWPETNALDYASLVFTGEKPTEPVVLDGDRDWRGLGAMDIPFALDLNGHKLYIVLPGAGSVNETAVTSTAEGGELHATVAADKVHDNTSVALTGNLSLIKEGPGTFVQTLTAQSYAGETRVVEGVLATAGGDMSGEGVSLFGTDKSVTVEAGAALDPRGSYNWSDYTIILDGGMISNTVEEIGSVAGNKTAYNISESGFNRRFNPNVTLLKDSTFATTKAYTFFATVDSNGYELQNWIATDAEVRWQPKTKTDGKPLTMDITGGGKLFILKNLSLNQPTMTLKMSDGWVTMGGDMVVSNYVAASKVESFDYKNTNAVMNVWGTFTPVTQNFVGCTLQDGSTIDLSKQSDSWNSRGYTKLGKDGKNTVKGDVDFAEGATVTIEVGDREFKGTEQIVAWSDGSKASAAGATFVLSAAARAKGYSLSYDENGLWICRKGLMLLIR